MEKQEKKTNAPGQQRECPCHHKATPRSGRELTLLQNRIKRMVGQLGGISKMLDDNRYCGDILMQVAAVESALQSFGYLVLQSHLETQVIEEAVELIKRLK